MIMVTKFFASKAKGKKYNNGVLNFAHNYPLLGIVLIPLLFDWPAKALQAGVRTVKHGDPRLGSAPLAMQLNEPQDGMSGLSLFGSITKQGANFDEGNTFPARGDMYRDTSHLNSAKEGAMYGTTGADGYTDTRHLTRPRAVYQTDGGFLNARGKGPKPDTRPSYSKADPALAEIVGQGSVFRGISGLGRVRR
jgi:hypothetical protein